MKMSCSVIRDLLPLYVEKLTGEESAALVEAHLEECEDCKSRMEAMEAVGKKNSENEFSHEAAPLLRIKKDIKEYRRAAAGFGIFGVLVLMLVLAGQLTKPVYLPYSQEFMSIAEGKDGSVYAIFSEEVTDFSRRVYKDADNVTICEITAWYTLWDKIFPKGTRTAVLTSSREEIRTAYYCDNTRGGEMIAVYGALPDGGAAVLPRLALGQYAVLSAAAALVLGIAWLLFYRRKKLQRAIGLLQLVPFSYLLGHLLIKGTETVSYSMPRDFVMIVFIAAGIYGLILFGILLKRQRNR